MADNDFEYHAQDVAKRRERKARELQRRRNALLAAYRRQLDKQRHSSDDKPKHDGQQPL